MSLQQLDDFRIKLLANAESLLSDPRLLADAKALPACFTLCVLATEELAKLSAVWFIRKTLADGKSPDWPELTKILHSHQTKLELFMGQQHGLGLILASEHPTLPKPELLASFIKEVGGKRASILNRIKQHGLYVELKDTGDAVSPEGSIDESMAIRLLKITEHSLHFHQMLDAAASKVIGGPSS